MRYSVSRAPSGAYQVMAPDGRVAAYRADWREALGLAGALTVSDANGAREDLRRAGLELARVQRKYGRLAARYGAALADKVSAALAADGDPSETGRVGR